MAERLKRGPELHPAPKPAKTPRMSVFFRWAGWLLLAAITVFTLCPIGLRPTTGAPADVERALAFALIGGAFALGYPKHRLGAILLVVALAGILEAGQTLVPGRHGQVHDLLVKALGAAVGALVAAFLGRPMRQVLQPQAARKRAR